MAIPISSANDPRLEPYRDLPAAKKDRAATRCIAESEFVVRRLLESTIEVESLLATPAATERLEGLVPASVPLFVASKAILSDIVGYRFHAGVLACAVRPRFAPVMEVIAQTHAAPDARAHGARPSRVVALSQVVDADNVGSIVRSAAAFGADALVLDDRCADAYSRRAIRVSVGNIFKLPVIACDDFAGELRRLRDEQGYRLFALVADADAEALESASPTGRDLLLFGGEGYGLRDDLRQMCDCRLTIPTDPNVDSLNVAVASAITLHHFARPVCP